MASASVQIVLAPFWPAWPSAFIRRECGLRLRQPHARRGCAESWYRVRVGRDHLREGDVLTVWKLDRLGRNTHHVLAVVDELTSRACNPAVSTRIDGWLDRCL